MLTIRDFDDLFHAGLRYRYTEERWQQLASLGGHPFPSPTERRNGYVEELIQPATAPIELTAKEVSDLQTLAEVWQDFQNVQIRLARSPDLFPWLRSFLEGIMTPLEWENRLTDPGYDVVAPFTRFDCIRTPHGFKIVDINSTRPAGVGDIAIQAERITRQGWCVFPIGQRFASVVRTCFMQWSRRIGNCTPARVAILVEDGDGDWWNCKLLADLLSNETWVELAELRSEIPDTNEGFNLIIRNRMKEGHRLFTGLQAIRPERACVLSPLYRRWMGNKEWMAAFFSRPEASDLRSLLFTTSSFDQEYGDPLPSVGDYFLPTGRIRNGMISLNGELVPVKSLVKKDWMVKPPRGSSGHGITIGRSATTHAWQDACQEGALLQEFRRVKEPVWVLDEKGNPHQDVFYTKYGVYVFNGEVAGLEVMARKQPLVHGARDTYLTTVVLPQGTIP